MNFQFSDTEKYNIWTEQLKAFIEKAKDALYPWRVGMEENNLKDYISTPEFKDAVERYYRGEL